MDLDVELLVALDRIAESIDKLTSAIEIQAKSSKCRVCGGTGRLSRDIQCHACKGKGS